MPEPTISETPSPLGDRPDVPRPEPRHTDAPRAELDRAGVRRPRTTRAERRLFGGGVAAATLHFLDISLAGADTTLPGLAAIAAVGAALVLAHRRAPRPVRALLAAMLGVVFTGFGSASHGLHVFTVGPDWPDLTGIAFTLGGVALLAAAVAALRAPRGPRRSGPARRAGGALGWTAAAAMLVVATLVTAMSGIMSTHAPRNAVGDLGIAHENVRFETANGDRMAGWYVPSSNGAAVVLMHGSTGNKSRVAQRARMLARHGYGVLLFDAPGHGESEGRSHLAGWNAMPAARAAVDWLERRPDVDRRRIAGFGVSMGGETLLDATGHDRRLRALISDGAGARTPADAEAGNTEGSDLAGLRLGMGIVRVLSGTREPEPLADSAARIAGRPLLLIAGGREPDEPTHNRRYLRAAGPSADLWEIPEAGHTAGPRVRPAEYERRTIGFLDRALGVHGSR